MPEKIDPARICVYVTKAKQEEKMVERLVAISQRENRSVNFLVIQAVAEFLQREEAKK